LLFCYRWWINKRKGVMWFWIMNNYVQQRGVCPSTAHVMFCTTLTCCIRLSWRCVTFIQLLSWIFCLLKKFRFAVFATPARWNHVLYCLSFVDMLVNARCIKARKYCVYLSLCYFCGLVSRACLGLNSRPCMCVCCI
jgi:hypothetical protein